MKKFYAIMVIVVMTIFAAAAICYADELVKNPTAKDLEGKWSGSYTYEGKKGKMNSDDINITFALEKNNSLTMTTSSTTDPFKNVSVSGSTISATNQAKNVSFQLYKKSNGKLVLKGQDSRYGGASVGFKATSSDGSYEVDKK
jgi:hypothetical protein